MQNDGRSVKAGVSLTFAMNLHIKKIYQKLTPDNLRSSKLLRRIIKEYYLRFRYDHTYDRYDWDEAHVSLGGRNPDKTFFVIRKQAGTIGLLSSYLTAVVRLKLIENSGYIPIIDMETHYHPGIDDQTDKNKKINAWEHYFLPISAYCMDDVKRSKNVIFSEAKTTPQVGMCLFDKTKVTEEILEDFYDINDKYMKLKPELLDRFERKYNELIKGKRVLGTMIRDGYFFLAAGRDQGAPEYKNHPGIERHPKQPTPWELCDILEQKMKDWNCDYLYVIAETTYSLNVFKERFGEKLIHSGRDVKQIDELNFSKYYEAAISYNQTHARVQENIFYLEEVYLLSKCTSVTAGKCSGSVVAALWNHGKYEHMDVLQFGIY